MIGNRELLELGTEWALDVRVIEKDYMLGWLLAGIANEPTLRETWIFKGGTCLRKCYHETYRLSEDLTDTAITRLFDCIARDQSNLVQPRPSR